MRLSSEVSKFIGSDIWTNWKNLAPTEPLSEELKASRFVGRFPVTSAVGDQVQNEGNLVSLRIAMAATPFANEDLYGNVQILIPFQTTARALARVRLLNMIMCIQAQASHANLVRPAWLKLQTPVDATQRNEFPALSAISVSTLLTIGAFVDAGLFTPALKFYSLTALPMTRHREASTLRETEVLRRHFINPPFAIDFDHVCLCPSVLQEAPCIVETTFRRVSQRFEEWYFSAYGNVCSNYWTTLRKAKHMEGYQYNHNPLMRRWAKTFINFKLWRFSAPNVSVFVLKKVMECLRIAAHRSPPAVEARWDSKENGVDGNGILSCFPSASLKGLLDILLRHHLLKVTTRVDGEKDRHCIHRVGRLLLHQR